MTRTSQRPTPQRPRSFRFPRFDRARLANGLEVIVCHISGRPLGVAFMLFDAGNSYEPSDALGVASLTARALTEGTTERDAVAFADATERLGATIDAHVDWDAMSVVLEAPISRMPGALELFAEAIRSPAFAEREIERLKDERRNEIRQQHSNPTTRAMLEFPRHVYTEESVYARPRAGSFESVSGLDRDDVVSFYRRWATPGASTLIVAADLGAVPAQALAEKLFGDWDGADAPRPDVPVEESIEETTITIVDRPESVQSVIALGHMGIARSDPDFHAVTLMEETLGGSFNSRLNLKLREEKGYTYGARCSFDARRKPGAFSIFTQVQTDVTAPAVRDALDEIARMRDGGPTKQEVDESRDYMVGVFPLRFEAPSSIASGIANLAVHGLPDDYYDRYGDMLGAVAVDDCARVARAHLRPDRSAVVVVGDASKIADPLRAIDAGPVAVVPDEAPG